MTHSKRPPGRPRKHKLRPKKLTNVQSMEEKNGAIAVLRSQGASIRDVAHAIGVAPTTIARGGFQTPQKRARSSSTVRDNDSPRAPTPNQRERRKLVRKFHKQNRLRTSQDIVWLLKEHDIHVDKRTVARDHRALGARHLTCDRVQRLNEAQTAKRLAFCKHLLKTYPESDPFWSNLVFSDKTKRGTSDMDSTAWVLPDESRPLREQQRWDCKIHVWGYIGLDGVRCVRRADGSVVSGASYLGLLQGTVGKRNWRKQRWWQQDNAPAHTARIVTSWLKENVQCLADWPPNSPDLSPIENLWGRMWADALKLKPKDTDELWNAVQTVFRNYPESYIRDLIMSFRRRLQLCVECGGATISDHY